MRPDIATVIALSALSTNFPALSAPQHHSSYGCQQHCIIKSLSRNDVEELRRGGGWGLAKAAELNGMPGPVHLLNLKNKIALTPDQSAAIKAIFSDMRRQAIAKGEQLISLDKQLDTESKRVTLLTNGYVPSSRKSHKRGKSCTTSTYRRT